MAAGDTLNVIPGTYPPTQRFQLADFDKGSAWTSGNYTIIRCTVPMEAIIKNTSAVNMTGNNSWYFYVEGLVFDYVTASKEIQGGQWKFIKCGFKGGPSTGNDTNLQIGTNNFTPGASNWLLEDCYWVGYSTNSGRYQLLIYESQYGIVRRGVAWMGDGWDDGGSTNPSGNITVYNSSYTYIQNFIVLDTTAPPDTFQAAYYRVNNTGQSFDGDRNEWWGGMARNVNGWGVYYDGGAVVSSETWRHMTLIDTFSGGATFGYGPSTTLSFENFAVLRASHTASVASQYGIQAGNAGTQIVRNGIVSSWEDDSVAGISPTYIDCHNNGGTCDGGAGEVTYAPRTNGLTYMHRIEDGSNLKTAGLSGGQIGPQNVYKMGTDGTLYGETGWNTLTSNALWPWPNQTEIRAALCSAYSHGMCAGSQSLSSYMTFGYEAPRTGTPPANISTVTVSAGRMGIFAVNSNLYASEATWNLEVASVSAMGLGLFRSNWDMWDQIEPSSGTFTFTEMQSRLDLVRNAGMRVSYYYPIRPEWHPSIGCPVINPFFALVDLATTQCAVSNMGVYNRFVSTIAYTFCEEIDEHEIYNEPDFLFGSTNPAVYVQYATNAITNIWRVCPGASITLPALAHPARTLLAGNLTAANTTYLDHHWFADFLDKFNDALPNIGATVTLSSFTWSLHEYYDSDNGNQTFQKSITTMTAMLANQGVTNPVFQVTEVGKFGGSYTTSNYEAEEVGKSSFTYRAYAQAVSPNTLLPQVTVKSIIFHNFAGYDFSATTTSYAPRYSYYTLKKLATLDGYTAVGDQDADTNESVFKFTNGANTKYIAWTEAGTASFDPGGASTVTDVYGDETQAPGSITLTTAPQFIEVNTSGGMRGLNLRGFNFRGFR